MKKYIVQLQNDLEHQGEKKVVRAEEVFDSENFQTSIVEVEEIELKENEHLELVFDSKENKVIAKAVQNEKTEIEKLHERLDATMTVVDEIMENIGG